MTSLLIATDIYGRTCIVAEAEYLDRKRTLIALRFRNGRKWTEVAPHLRPSGAGGATHIHRENIATTGKRSNVR